VHGAWHGGWCWHRVGDRLHRAGHRVFAPTLTGVGERRHLLSSSVDLETHIQDILGVLDAEELEDVVLVGHSYAGLVISGVAARARERLRQLVYLDAVLVEDGQSWADAMPPEIAAARRRGATVTNGVKTIPAPDPEIYGFADPADTAWVRRRMTPHPFVPFEQSARVGAGVPRIFIDCTQPRIAALSTMKERYRGRKDWPFIEMKTGHDAMLSAPEELTRLLLQFA
jgi:pimeloyl-ACP methyl ester carboxylesterase